MRNLFTFFVVAMIGLTSCEKPEMVEDINNIERNDVGAKAYDLRSNSGKSSSAKTTIEYAIVDDADANVIGQIGSTILVKEATEFAGTPDTDSYEVTASVAYYVDSEGALIVTRNTANNSEPEPLRFEAGTFSIQ